MVNWWISLLLLFSVLLLRQSVVRANCVWYGEYSGPVGQHLPVVHTAPAQRLNDHTANNILQRWCPDLASGSVCCDSNQLSTLDKSLSTIDASMGYCPTCFKKALFNLFCSLTCSPEMNTFVRVDKRHELTNLTVVLGAKYNVEPAIANKLYESCKTDRDIARIAPRITDPLCGTYCDSKDFVLSIAPVINQLTSYNIDISINGQPGQTPPSEVTTEASSTRNGSIVDCDSPSWPVIQTFNNCSTPCLTVSQKEYFDETFGSEYRVAQIFVQPTDHSDKAETKRPSETWGPAFNKAFLNAALTLQEGLSSHPATYAAKAFGFEDVCWRPTGVNGSQCVILSTMQYFQHNRTRLDASRPKGSATVDYIDHLRYCWRFPWSDDKDLDLPCTDNSGQMLPHIVLEGYPQRNFHQASTLVISFLLPNPTKEADFRRVEAWVEEASKFVSNYSDPSVKCTFATWNFPLSNPPKGPIDGPAPPAIPDVKAGKASSPSSGAATSSSGVLAIMCVAIVLGVQRKDYLL